LMAIVATPASTLYIKSSNFFTSVIVCSPIWDERSFYLPL
jgi:hypothetical protein